MIIVAVDDIEVLKRKINNLEKIVTTLHRQVIVHTKQNSSLNAKLHNMELQVNHLTNLINRSRDK